ncbi:uncharacterized protein LOC131039131 isoform X2 [Cryptomeria japonica]|uniref:uncharacterized protein LOC131039131 isoform X2 n=1 Tax=Cryptomeria japonica TaxID=3369 RepID=UPI0025AB75CB|nr:uncharacterized protein LOC131039131 isoform X2 [Cryptomeria japonica]
MAMAAAMKDSLVCNRIISIKHSADGESSGVKMPKVSYSLGGYKRIRHRNIVFAASATNQPVLQDSLKRAVAKKAMELIKPGMVVGLGTGSTASMAIEELGKLIQQGKLKNVIGVGATYQSRVLARQFGVKTVDLNDVNHIDIALDGADEVDSSMNVLKGGGAAHTMGKVEVLPQAISPVLRKLVSLGGVPEIRNALRKDGPVITDLGNMVVDVSFPEGIKDPASLEQKINLIPGVIENGLLTGVASSVLVATQDGDDITVIELDEFVKSLKSLSEENSKS